MKEETNNKDKLIYLNTAAAGLLSPASVSATTAFQEATLTNPSKVFLQWIEGGLAGLREKVAGLLHSGPAQVAFTPNFSYSLLPVIQSIAPTCKKVLLYRQDYPSLNMPFELGGFEVHYVESPDGFSLPLSVIQETAERETVQVIALSHVQFLTGFTTDLQALGQYCRQKDIVLIVDATQSMGAVDIDFDKLDVDVLASSSYKWLNGGYGSAVLCIKESFLRRFPPTFAGFGSMTHGESGWQYTPSIISYEPGHQNVLGLLQLEQAVDQRLLDGVPAVEKHNRALLKQLAEGLAGTPYPICGGGDISKLTTMLCFEGDQPLHQYLTQNGFAVTWRRGLIRVSPHFYNSQAEIAAFVKAVKAHSGSKLH